MARQIKGYLLDSLILPALSLFFTEYFVYCTAAEIIQQQLQRLFSHSECTLDKLVLHN
ncbi:hypothetical protein AX17_007262, partial [Amanita inopinata Kibby_2008]